MTHPGLSCPHGFTRDNWKGVVSCRLINDQLGYTDGISPDDCSACQAAGVDDAGGAAVRLTVFGRKIDEAKRDFAEMPANVRRIILDRHTPTGKLKLLRSLTGRPGCGCVYRDRREMALKWMRRHARRKAALERAGHYGTPTFAETYSKHMRAMEPQAVRPVTFPEKIRDVTVPVAPTWTACIATFNEGPQLEATIALLLACEDPPDRIIVVDDCSKVSPASRVRPLLRPCDVLIENGRRVGSGPSKHLAVSKARTDVVVVLDAHVRVPYDFYAYVRDALAAHPSAVFMFPSHGIRAENAGTSHSCDFAPGEIRAVWKPLREGGDHPRVPCVMGGVYAFARETIEYLGGFAPDLEGYGREEEWLSLRAWKRGHECRVVMACDVGHHYRKPEDVDRTDRWGVTASGDEVAKNERRIRLAIEAPHHRDVMDYKTLSRSLGLA